MNANETTHVVEVEFSIDNDRYPFIGTSERAECTFELAEMISRGEGEYAEFFHVTGASPERIVGAVDDHDAVTVTLLSEYEDGGLFEFVVAGHCPAYELAERGGLPREVRGDDGEGTIVIEIPAQYDPPSVIATFLDEYPSAEIAAKREKESVAPRFTRNGFHQVLANQLTERQREVLSTAFEAGYYDWPRRATGEEVAAELDISSATFCEHIHTAERKLFGILFDESRGE